MQFDGDGSIYLYVKLELVGNTKERCVTFFVTAIVPMLFVNGRSGLIQQKLSQFLYALSIK